MKHERNYIRGGLMFQLIENHRFIGVLMLILMKHHIICIGET